MLIATGAAERAAEFVRLAEEGVAKPPDGQAMAATVAFAHAETGEGSERLRAWAAFLEEADGFLQPTVVLMFLFQCLVEAVGPDDPAAEAFIARHAERPGLADLCRLYLAVHRTPSLA